MPKKYNNIIHELFLRSKIINLTLSSITKIRPIVYIEDPEEASSINLYLHKGGY